MTLQNTYSVLRLLMLTLGILLPLQSCLTDNRDDCDPELPKVRIVVKTLAEETRAADNAPIENVRIYIFRETGELFTTWEGDSYIYGQSYIAELALEPGIYHFVVWTNQDTSYLADPDCSSMDRLVVSLQYPSDKKVTEDLPELHHGMWMNAEVIAGQENEFFILVRPNTYRLNFTVEGLPTGTTEYSFTVRDNNSHYAFDNSIIEGKDEFEYIRIVRFTDDRFTATLNVLRLTDDRSPLFDFSDITVGLSLHSDDLVQMIRKAYASSGHTVDFDSEFEFDIILKFDAHMDVTVTVNGWDYTPNPTPLG